jgi:hypothetical protein
MPLDPASPGGACPVLQRIQSPPGGVFFIFLYFSLLWLQQVGELWKTAGAVSVRLDELDVAVAAKDPSTDVVTSSANEASATVSQPRGDPPASKGDAGLKTSARYSGFT